MGLGATIRLARIMLVMVALMKHTIRRHKKRKFIKSISHGHAPSGDKQTGLQPEAKVGIGELYKVHAVHRPKDWALPGNMRRGRYIGHK